MKNINFRILFLILLFGNLFILTGQCLPNGITFTSQTQIDDFPSNYPGCTEIVGDVFIAGNLSNLDGLSQIRNIGGFLKINNTTLENLDGLENLQTIESLLIEYNNNLQNIQALANITSVSRILLIVNESLLSLSGLEGITNIPLELNIHQNQALESLMGLQNLVNIGNNCTIYLNSQLHNLNGLESLSQIGGSFGISENSSLITLQGLDNLSEIGINFTLSRNPQMITLSNLANLTSIGGNLLIQNQTNLPSLDGLENLISIGGTLNISVNNSLSNIEDIKNIDATTITQLQIFQNENLPECAVQSVCEFLNLDPANAVIDTNAIGCNSVQEVEASCELSIQENPLSRVKIYPNPTNGSFTISNVKVGTIKILDSQGRIVRDYNMGDSFYSAKDLSEGIYFVQIQSGNQTTVRQLIKN
ncbi:T9SS type A sorting domain-containing protein [Marixanthomonas ophiurae]|uniref:T9SS C-terminal target domain-containing protein n=1 Tax=Marixanthomonas ophiurae TaxID=387659 RepID=A0A3E1Q6T7_9FLAO|nr:T9SS type A sorting domain-containing protein [Marixanthomonas ophiurae]RFN57839.1 T9SS C-terminal target domain-containing protein [Marixanthomonas ophiurae]